MSANPVYKHDACHSLRQGSVRTRGPQTIPRSDKLNETIIILASIIGPLLWTTAQYHMKSIQKGMRKCKYCNHTEHNHYTSRDAFGIGWTCDLCTGNPVKRRCGKISKQDAIKLSKFTKYISLRPQHFSQRRIRHAEKKLDRYCINSMTYSSVFPANLWHNLFRYTIGLITPRKTIHEWIWEGIENQWSLVRSEKAYRVYQSVVNPKSNHTRIKAPQHSKKRIYYFD